MTNEEFKNQIKNLSRSIFEKKSDSALRHEMLQKAHISQTTTSVQELLKLSAEIELCKEILEERAHVNECKQQEMEVNQKAKQIFAQETIVKLKDVFSANAQLIFAMLEEEGDKSLQEIIGWCDEFQMMGGETVEELLSHLCSLKLIKKTEENKYHLLHIAYQSPYKYPWSSKEDRQEAMRYEMTHPEDAKTGEFSVFQALYVVLLNCGDVCYPIVRRDNSMPLLETQMKRFHYHQASEPGNEMFKKALEQLIADFEENVDMIEYYMDELCNRGVLVRRAMDNYDFPLITD